MAQIGTGICIKVAVCVRAALWDNWCCMCLSYEWQSSRLLVCRGCPEPGGHVSDLSLVHWFQHFLTIQSEWPRWRATHQTDLLTSIIPMILPHSYPDSWSHYLRWQRNNISIQKTTLRNILSTCKQALLTLFYTRRRMQFNPSDGITWSEIILPF